MTDYLVSHRTNTGEWSFPRSYNAESINDLRHKLIHNGQLDRHKALRIAKDSKNVTKNGIGYLELLPYDSGMTWFPQGHNRDIGAPSTKGNVYIIWFNQSDIARNRPLRFSIVNPKNGILVRQSRYVWPIDPLTGGLMGRKTEVF